MFLAAAASASDAKAQTTPPSSAVTETSTEWFEDARFGMFIHWGVYAQAGGEWKGQRYYGISEWLMRRAKIPTGEYRNLASDFNPTAFDAREWVKVAKDSGVKYIVITSKHHDGFAMFNSAASDYDITDASPFKRDPLAELAVAARDAGIRLGFYYSQYQDWAEPDAGGNDWEFPKEGRVFDRYLQRKAVPQLTELLTNYGPVGLVWFDTPQELSKEDAQRLRDHIKRLQPSTLVSSRVGHGLGDYEDLRDAEVPAWGRTLDKPWEALFTHNDSWGYSKFDQNFKSSTELVRLLATVAGKGGNFLLNVGPDATGRLPKRSVDSFREVGAWLKGNATSIYGTKGSPVGPVPWGAITSRPGRLYLHVLQRPRDGELLVPGLGRTDVTGVRLLVGGGPLTWRRAGADLIVRAPATLPDPRDTVIELSYAGPLPTPAAYPTLLSQQYDQAVLEVDGAAIAGDAQIKRIRNYAYFGDWKHFASVDGLDAPSDSLEWSVRVLEPGAYHVSLEYAAGKEQAGKEGIVEFGGHTLVFQVVETGELKDSAPAPLYVHQLGVVDIGRPGAVRLRLRPAQAAGSLFTLKRVIITPHT